MTSFAAPPQIGVLMPTLSGRTLRGTPQPFLLFVAHNQRKKLIS